MSISTDWHFVGGFDEGRGALLTDPRRSFDDLVAALSLGTVVCARWEWGRDREISGRARVALELQAPEDIVDLFHNGIDGYRARYYRDIVTGEAANADCLLTLTAMLREEAHPWGLGLPAPGFPADWQRIAGDEVERSLRGNGAKVWISEAALRQRYGPDWAPSDADEKPHELLVQRWIDAIKAAAGQGGDVTRFAGTQAFRVDRLSVRGGFIVPGDPDSDAIVPSSKQARSREINARGFS